MKCSKSLRLRRSPNPLVAKGFLLSAIAASRLRHSQFEVYSQVLISTPPSRSQVFSPCRPLFQFCGADELWILLYTLPSPNLCFRAFCCYFTNPDSNKNFIHLLFFRFDC